MSTDQFANQLLRGTGIQTSFNTGASRRHCNGHGVMHVYVPHPQSPRVYRMDRHGSLTLQPVEGHWHVDENETKPMPFEKFCIDRKLSRTALAEYPHYRDFVDWSSGVAMLKGKAPLTRQVFGRGISSHSGMDRVGREIEPRRWLEIVSDRDLWPQLIGQTYHPPHEWGCCVRDAIYREHEVVKKVELPYVEGWRDYDAIKRSHRLKKYV